MAEQLLKAAVVWDAKAELGEGPCWDERERRLYWVNIMGKTLNTYDPATGEKRAYDVGQLIGAAVPRQSGGWILAMEHGFYSFDPVTGELAFIGNPEGRKPDTRFNDGKCDAAGRFWAGTMSKTGVKEQGALYCLETDGSIRTVLENVSTSNGIAWSPDNRTMYYIDSPTKKVMAYDYDLSSGAVGNPRTVIEVTDEGAVPDGMSCDAEGNLWVALWGGAKVRCWNPATGELLRTVEVPALQSSSCTFGGKDGDELYITSARTGLSEEQLRVWPLSGGLFVVKAGVKGQPTYAYGG
jgi:sugar lactone lactonase YvrE